MKRTALLAGAILLALGSLSSAASAQASSNPLPEPLQKLVSHIVLRVTPSAEIDNGPQIILAQYRTFNHVFDRHSPTGQKLPALIELGPIARGFYLQIDQQKSSGKAAVQTLPPSADQPWTTVISTYPFAKAPLMLVMTWEAGKGAPAMIPTRLRAALLHYAEER